MRRVGALLGAVAMVVVALAVRGSLGDDDSAGGSASEVVVCPHDLAEACAGLGGARTRPMGATADELIAADAAGELDGTTWIMPSAWAELVLAERERLGRDALFELEPTPLASSEVVLLTWEEQAQQLDAACGVNWSCIASEPDVGFRIRTGAAPVDSAIGLPVAAAQVGALLGRSDFAANDFDLEPGFRSAAARLAAGQVEDPVVVMRTRGPGQLSAVGTVDARARSLDSSFGTIVARPGEPPTRVDLVILSTRGGLAADARERLADGLVAAGWDAPGDGDDGLPAGGVLAAVRTLWTDT